MELPVIAFESTRLPKKTTMTRIISHNLSKTHWTRRIAQPELSRARLGARTDVEIFLM